MREDVVLEVDVFLGGVFFGDYKILGVTLRGNDQD